MAGRPARSAHRPREHRLRVPGGLLGPQPEHAAHGVQGGDHAEDADRRGEEGVGEVPVAAHPFEDLAGGRVVPHEVGGAVDDGAEDGARDREAGRPAQQRAALQPPREPEGAAQPAGRGRRPRPRGQEARTDVAPPGQGVRGRRRERRRPVRQHEHPPAVAREGPHLLAPPDGGDPHQGRGGVGARGVARGAEEEREAHRGARDAPRRPGGLAQLGRHRREAREAQPRTADRQAERQRARARQPEAGEPRRADEGHQAVGAHGGEQRRGERRPAAHHGRGQQLLTARLLLLAGVPDHEEHTHDRGEDAAEGHHPPGDQPAGRVREHRPVQRAQRAVGVRRAGDAGPVGRRVVEGPERVRGADHGEREGEHPHRQHHPVAAQREPQQCAGAGERGGADRADGGAHRVTAPGRASFW